MSRSETKPEGRRAGLDTPMMHYAMDTIGGYEGTFDDENVLVSAGVGYRNPGSDLFSIHVPDDPNHLIVDSGGFQAAVWFRGTEGIDRGLELPGGVDFPVQKWYYPYSPRELHTWGDEIGADVVAGMDVACEDSSELFDFHKGHSVPGDYRERLSDALWFQVRQQIEYQQGDYDHAFMPVIQGQNLEEYRNFIQDMDMHGLTEHDHIGVGTVCKRSSLDELLKICMAVREYFPKKHIHLFGATLNLYKDGRFDGLYDSTDTAAWNYGARSKAHKKELYEEYTEKVSGYQTPGQEQARL